MEGGGREYIVNNEHKLNIVSSIYEGGRGVFVRVLCKSISKMCYVLVTQLQNLLN